MNPPSDPAARALAERVSELITRAEQLARQGRQSEAHQAFSEAETLQPEHPLVLHEKGRRLLVKGDAAAALPVFERLVQLAPGELTFWMSLAATLRRLNRHEEEMRVLERALALDPTHLVVLLQKGALLDLLGRPRAAAATYIHALQTLSPRASLPPAIEAHVAHARARVAENAAGLARALEQRLASRPQGNPEERMRFERCVDRVLGRRRVYVPEPTSVLFPFLSPYEFFPREHFPWLTLLEDHTDIIRQELQGVLQNEQAELRPYIAYPEGVPLNQWKDLNHSRSWSAYFLWREGTRVTEHMTRCPRTCELLSQIPQVEIAGRGPTAFFSILEPHTHIPPHTGVTNTRSIVHLPLIVPGPSRFRVGGETRSWREGEAWVFDDTIEHEAWNEADLPRAILILDVWNPFLTPLERDLVREMTLALQEFNEEGASGSTAI
jgi:aspartyl/asparaginyl beta-hydroxylase (cupin superfamily)/Tfp pilus assembly protein PilF